MTPIELLFERPGLAPPFGLPRALADAYGGDFGLDRPRLFANFVSSVDGVVALPGPLESGRIVSGDSEPDRFVMALLRACADAVVIGAGTFRHAKGALWRAEDAYPPAAPLYSELRKKLGLPSEPRLVVVTASGKVDTAQPALRNALVATTSAGEARLRGAMPSGASLVVLGSDRGGLASLMQTLRSQGLQSVLTEGGPTLAGQLLEDGLLDELFLTLSPKLFGRSPGDGRKSLVDGHLFAAKNLELVSARRHESHLFLRYARKETARLDR